MRGFQLHIPQPCHENWDDMRPEERGRYCGSCAKTVVDLSAMSDREVIDYLARAGQQICGRMAADQLNRKFELVSPAPKKRWTVWKLVLAGLLIWSKGTAQTKSAKVNTHQQPVSPVRADSIPAPADSIKYKVLPEVTVEGYGRWMGKVVSGLVITTASNCSEETTLRQLVKDTLTTLRLLPDRRLGVYPNPVRKGSAVSLSWETAPGRYEVGLFNAAGALVQQRILEVGSASQVDLFEVPASLAGGIYFFRAVRSGSGKALTRKVEVL